MGRPAAALAAVLAAALLAAGCGGDEDGATTGPERATQICTSEEGGYRLEYPVGWHQERCAYFDPDEFEVPEATEFLDVAVLAGREPVEPGMLLGDDRTRTVLEQEATEIGGRDAVRVEAESTGEGLLDAGVRFYQVAVAADGESVILSTYDLGDLDYERNKQVVDELADSLEPTR